MKYAANVKRWADGWELHIEGVGVTQCRLLKDAAQQAADLIETVTGIEVDPDDIDIDLGLGELGQQIALTKELTATAERMQREAAAAARDVARALRREGLSVSDSATVLGVSRGRVSQLVKTP